MWKAEVKASHSAAAKAAGKQAVVDRLSGGSYVPTFWYSHPSVHGGTCDLHLTNRIWERKELCVHDYVREDCSV